MKTEFTKRLEAKLKDPPFLQVWILPGASHAEFVAFSEWLKEHKMQPKPLRYDAQAHEIQIGITSAVLPEVLQALAQSRPLTSSELSLAREEVVTIKDEMKSAMANHCWPVIEEKLPRMLTLRGKVPRAMRVEINDILEDLCYSCIAYYGSAHDNTKWFIREVNPQRINNNLDRQIER